MLSHLNAVCMYNELLNHHSITWRFNVLKRHNCVGKINQYLLSCIVSFIKEFSKKYGDCEFFKVDVDDNTVCYKQRAINRLVYLMFSS